MNILYREDLNGYSVSHSGKNGENIARTSNFSDIKRFLSVGCSAIFTANAENDCANGISAGDKVYFKINNDLGVSNMGRISESCGSCEDVAEVLGFYALRNLERTLGKSSVLRTTPYEFAEYTHEGFYKEISKRTGGFVDSGTMYGSISKNCIAPNAEIIHGDSMLSLVVPNGKVSASSSNTLFNYDTSLGQFVQEANKRGQQLIIHPITTRYLANTMFWDYFYANSDRHCKNINFQKVPLGDNKFLVEPLAIIDNGGGLSLQSANCEKQYNSFSKTLLNNDASSEPNGLPFNKYNVPYDFFVGSETFADDRTREAYDGLEYSEQLAVLLSTSKELYEDFANMYKNLDLAKALEDMHTELKFNLQFLPNLTEVTTTMFNLKQAEISASMANLMGEDFSIETFNSNPNYYLDKFGEYVQGANNLHIATNAEIAEFNESLFSTYGVVSEHNMSENLPQLQQTQKVTPEQLEELGFGEPSATAPPDELTPEVAESVGVQEEVMQEDLDYNAMQEGITPEASLQEHISAQKPFLNPTQLDPAQEDNLQ